MEQIKVAIFTDKWTRGGIESFIMNVCRKIDREKIHIEIFAFQNGTDQYDKELKELKIKKHTILSAEYITPVKRTLLAVRSFGRFLRYMKVNHFQIIHLNISHGVSFIYAFLSQLSGIKVRIVHSHNSSMGNGNNMYLKMLAHKAGKILWLGCANHYLACSDVAAEWLFDKKILTSGSYELVKNAVVTEHYRFSEVKREQLRKQLNLEDKLVIGHVGRFITQKNHRFMIDLIRLLIPEKPDIRLLLVGEGELEEEIKDHVKELRLEQYILFNGPSDDVPGMLSVMDLFLLPSFFEGNPVVGLEAQANGLRCLFSDTITSQAKVTDLVDYLDIKREEAGREWADVILHLPGLEENPLKRASYADAVRSSGYDIQEVAALLCSRYEAYLKEDKGQVYQVQGNVRL